MNTEQNYVLSSSVFRSTIASLRSAIMVLLISELAKIGATKPIFLDSGSPRGEGGFVRACVGMVCYHFIVHIPNSSKKLYLLCL